MQQIPKTPEEVVAAFPARPLDERGWQVLPDDGTMLIEARADKVAALEGQLEMVDPIQGFDVDVRFHPAATATAVQVIVSADKQVNKAYVQMGMVVVDILFYDNERNVYRFVGGPQGFDTIFTFNGKPVPGVTKIAFEAQAGKAIAPLYWWSEDGLCHRLINGSAPEVVNLPEPTEEDRLRLIENSQVDNPEETVTFLNELLPPPEEDTVPATTPDGQPFVPSEPDDNTTFTVDDLDGPADPSA